MNPFLPGRAGRAANLIAALGLVFSTPLASQVQAPAPGTDLFVLDVAGTPIGEIPTAIKLLQGNMEMVMKDGRPMLKATAASSFVITLAQVLPQDFTLEFDIVPKACCNPQDLSFEGTAAIDQGPASAHIQWDSDGQIIVVGGGEMYQSAMPEDFAASLPGVLTSVVAVFQGNTVRLYTNGQRLFTLSDRIFARGRVLRVFLGGQDDNLHAVHLARMRIVAGAVAPTAPTVATATPPPGQPAPAPAAAPAPATVTAVPATPPTAQTGTITPQQPATTTPTGAAPSAGPRTVTAQPAPAPAPVAPILVGTGISDITGPIAGAGMLGYADFGQQAAGLHTRLFARAFIFASPASGKRVVFVSTELGMLYSSVKQGVLKKLATQFPGQYDDRNVMISATHTHAGPGGFSHHVLYNMSTFGHIAQNYSAIVDGITEAIAQADSRLGTGAVSVIAGEIADLVTANGNVPATMVNRSMVAFRLNPEARALSGAALVPAPPVPGVSGAGGTAPVPADSVNREVTVLKVQQGGKPIGVIAWHAVHNTSMTKTNILVSSDHKGYAAQLFEKQFGSIAPLQNYGGFVAAFPNGAEGDLSPNLNTTNPKEFRGPGVNEFQSMAIIGQREFDAAYGLFNANQLPVSGDVDFRHKFLLMPGLPVTSTPHTNGVGGKSLCHGAYGFSFMAGAEDGPGMSFMQEGMAAQTAAELVGYSTLRATVIGVIAAVFPPLVPLVADIMVKSEDPCHLPKPVVLPTGKLAWTPEIIPFQLLRVGQVAIAGIPGEMTMQAGRRLRDSLLVTLAPLGVQRVIITGLANEYSGYITTPEEYNAQQYEGASTIFGRLTFEAYQQAFREMAAAMVTGQPMVGANSPPPPDLGLLPQIELQARVERDELPAGEAFGQVLTQPDSVVTRGATVSTVYRSGDPRNDLRRNNTYFRIERHAGGGNWTLVAWDATPDTYLWWSKAPNCPNPDACYWSQMAIAWSIPSDATPGTYRIRFVGSWKNGVTGAVTRYQGTTRGFMVQ